MEENKKASKLKEMITIYGDEVHSLMKFVINLYDSPANLLSHQIFELSKIWAYKVDWSDRDAINLISLINKYGKKWSKENND